MSFLNLRGRLSRVSGMQNVPVPHGLAAVTRIDSASEQPAAAGGLSEGDVAEIWQACESLYRSATYPALSLCIRRKGAIVLNRTLGHARGNAPQDAADAEKIVNTPQTPICLFSASKAITAVLVHKLAEDGGIDLDRAIAHYLPPFARHGKGDITVADLLAHRGGVPSLDVPKADRRVELLTDWDRVVEMICQAKPMRGRPMAYHAITGGFVLGEVIRRVTGLTISEYLDQTLRRPLGMHYFTYGLPPPQRDLAASNAIAGLPVTFPIAPILERALMAPVSGVVEASNTSVFMDAVIPSGNAYSTAEELSRFYQMLLDQGHYQGRQILKPATIARMVRPRSGARIDRMLMIPMRYSEGMMLGGNPAGLYGPMTEQAYGHLGFLNILGWADPQRQVSVALLNTGKAILGPHLVPLIRLMSLISSRCR